MRRGPGTDRRLPRAAVAMAAVSVLATALSVVLYADNHAHLSPPPHYLFGDATAGVLYPLVGAWLVRRRPDNPVGWVFAGTSVLGVNAFCNQYAVSALVVHPHALPLGGLAAWVAAWGWTPELAVPALLPLLFPDGTLPSPRWRGYARLVCAVLATLVAAAMLAPLPIDASDTIQNPLGTAMFVGYVQVAAAALVLFVLVPVSVLALVLRQRRARGREREQLSWLSLAAVVAIVFIVLTVLVSGLWSEMTWTLAVAAVPAGVVLAVLRSQLLDIEVVLNRAVAYVLITGVVLVAYLAAVAGVGAAASQRTGVVTVAVLALLLAAGRERVQRGVARALYGDREDPYAVVARVGRGLDLATGPQEALQRLTEEVRTALRLPYVAVQAADPRVGPVEAGAARAGTTRLPVTVLGRHVGELVIGLRHRGERVRDSELALLTEVARHAGALIQAALLVADLQHSRERIVAGREEERRRLRRDLHDGIGPELAGMALQLDSLTSRLDGDPALAERARRLRDRMRGTVVEVRRVVDDLRPPALDELGLVGALREYLGVYALAAGGPGSGPVRMEVPEALPQLPAATEVAAYRIVAEAVNNAVRHGGARDCVVRLSASATILTVEVADDGSGIAENAQPGVGLQSMRERAAELGGAFDITATRAGTTVRAALPLEVP